MVSPDAGDMGMPAASPRQCGRALPRLAWQPLSRDAPYCRCCRTRSKGARKQKKRRASGSSASSRAISWASRRLVHAGRLRGDISTASTRSRALPALTIAARPVRPILVPSGPVHAAPSPPFMTGSPSLPSWPSLNSIANWHSHLDTANRRHHNTFAAHRGIGCLASGAIIQASQEVGSCVWRLARVRCGAPFFLGVCRGHRLTSRQCLQVSRHVADPTQPSQQQSAPPLIRLCPHIPHPHK